eukprot:GDKI01015487.1.p1 GENE.GDKI01015487.1~~GDKI01015487.1.p1  ORF type:complete len:309 (-),score=83.80 GDKI01015487.1:162-1088(-)
MVLGSEGTLGVVTEATLKVRPMPEEKRYGSVVFPDLKHGIAFMREVARRRIQPTSLRLMDNFQFKFGASLKPAPDHPGMFHDIKEWATKQYVLKVKGFDQDKLTAATIVWEGNSKEIDHQEKEIYKVAAAHHGLPAGADNGKNGYFLTFMIAYIRDFAMEHSWLGESFETCVPWSRVEETCEVVKQQIRDDCKKLGCTSPPLVSSRVTQVYDSGAAVYFYFGFSYKGLPEPLKAYEYIEESARNAVMRCGGSISHHHGVGKLRNRWFNMCVSDVGAAAVKAIKKELDPTDVFGCQNLHFGLENAPAHK